MRLYRTADGTIIEVADAQAAQLLQTKDKNGQPAYTQVTAAQEVKPLAADIQNQEDTSIGNKLEVGANFLRKGASLGLSGDNSARADYLASQNKDAVIAGTALSMFVPGSGEAALGNLATKVAGVKGAVGVSKVVRAGVAGSATMAAGALANDVGTALNTGDYSAIGDGLSPAAIVAGGFLTAGLEAKAARMESKVARVKASSDRVAQAEKAVAAVERKATSGIDKLDTDAYAEIKQTLSKEATNIEDARKAAKDVERQYQQAQKLQTEAPILSAKYERDAAAWGSSEQARSQAVASGQVQAAHDAEVAAYQAEVAAERAKHFNQYAKEQGLPKPKLSKSGEIAPLPAEHKAGFDRFLKERGMGHLTDEAAGLQSLPDRFMAHIKGMGDDLPTTPKEMRKVYEDFIESEGYQVAKQMGKRTIQETDAADNVYQGFYPEHNLRQLDLDEAARTFHFTGEIGQKGERAMVLTADAARTLTPGRAVTLLEKLSADEGQAMLRMMSPEARAQTLLHQAGVIRHADANILQKHQLARPHATNERAARLRLELEDAMNETLTPKATNAVKAPLKGPKPLSPEDLDPTPRPFPQAPPITDFTERVNSLGKQYEEVGQAARALEGLKLPNTAQGFVKMEAPAFERMAESVRTLKAHPNPDIAAVGEKVENTVRKTLTNMGVDVDRMVETQGDVMGVLNHTRKELRDHPARMQAYRAEMKAAQAELKSAQAAALENGGQITGGIKQQFGGIFGRYMGSKMLTGAAVAAGFSGNGVAAALGFAAGGAMGGAAGKAAMGKRLMSTEAMIAKAERGMKLAEAYSKLADLVPKLGAKASTSTWHKIFETKEDDFAAFFPEGKPKNDSHGIMELGLRMASAMQDPKSAGYRAAKDFIGTDPALAQSIAQTTSAKIHAMANVLPPVPPNGYSSKGGRYPILHPETIDRVKRACSAILHPTDCLARMIENGRFPQQELDIIRNTSPDMYAEAVMGMANELYAEDEHGKTLLSKMHPDVQLEFARGLGIDSIPGSAPGYIAAMQQMHAVSHQPKPGDQAKPLSSGQGIRAPGPDSSNATEAQRSTY